MKGKARRIAQRDGRERETYKTERAGVTPGVDIHSIYLWSDHHDHVGYTLTTKTTTITLTRKNTIQTVATHGNKLWQKRINSVARVSFYFLQANYINLYSPTSGSNTNI